MKNYNRDLLVLFRDRYTEDLVEKEVEVLHQIIRNIENFESFSRAHELVRRNRITSKPRLIDDATSREKLKPFHFLINKN